MRCNGCLVALLCLLCLAQPARACEECLRLAKMGVVAGGEGTRWSDPATWSQGKLPSAGDAVVIPVGKQVTLDVAPPRLASIFIKGQLLFAEQDLQLHAGWIMVTGDDALFQIGTEDKPFRHRAEITFYGTDEKHNVLGEDEMRMGTKFLGVKDGGRLELHGARRDALSWTQLAAHANPGDAQIKLAAAANWLPGDQIAIAPSGYNAREAEIVTITKMQGDAVSFQPALKHKHWGELQQFAGKTLDERAEVGLLTRNIVLQGAEDSLASAFGGHVMIMPGGTAHVEGVELVHMGQRGHQGRYPLHWHLVDRYGDGEHRGQGQYAKNCSIHHSFQRAIVVHGTSGVRVEGNVACDVTNHCFVPAEDGDEEGNIFRGSLGMYIRDPDREEFAFPGDGGNGRQSTQREDFSSVFWLKNPNQVLVGNHAAGSVGGNGFFFDNTKTEQGEDYDRVDGMTFESNVAHSNGNGRDPLAPGGASYQHANTNFGLFNLDVGGRGNNRKAGTLVFKNFTAYKNAKGGAWLEEREEQMLGGIMADQSEGVRVVQNARLEDVVFIGRSANDLGEDKRIQPDVAANERSDSDRKRFGPVGLFFNKRNVGTAFRGERLTFVNCAHGIHTHQAAPQGEMRDCTFENVAAPFYANVGGYEGKGKYGSDTRLLDADGSISGTGKPTLITVVYADSTAAASAPWTVRFAAP